MSRHHRSGHHFSRTSVRNRPLGPIDESPAELLASLKPIDRDILRALCSDAKDDITIADLVTRLNNAGHATSASAVGFRVNVLDRLGLARRYADGRVEPWLGVPVVGEIG